MPPAAGTRARILVVDDREESRVLAERAIQKAGYDVVTAEGGVAALSTFDQAHPDCVLLDVKMHGMDGFEVCERIRARPEGASTPILFFTELRDIDTFDRALRAGANDFLTKPVNPAELVVRVESALKLRRLTGELKDHYEQLKRQRDDLFRLQLHKERLMAFVVHDLKNPVNSMDLLAQVLLREKELSARGHETTTKLRHETRRLNRLILNLLDIAKSEEGRLAPRLIDLDLRMLVDEVLADQRAAAESRGVTLQRSIEADRIRMDDDLFRRTLTNLVENAIRHAPKATAVSITAREDSGTTEVRVSDGGSGVPPEMREKIFDPFVQLQQGEEETVRRGRGLGLTFCKLVVEAHGGRLWVEDAAPGAAFCMSFPRPATEAKQPAPRL